MTAIANVWVCGQAGQLVRASAITTLGPPRHMSASHDGTALDSEYVEIVAGTHDDAAAVVPLTYCTPRHVGRMLADLAREIACAANSEEPVLFVHAKPERPGRLLISSWEVRGEPIFWGEESIRR